MNDNAYSSAQDTTGPTPGMVIRRVHAALLLMLGARITVTPFHHQLEAQHPKNLSAIYKLPADYPIS
jgi:hypothetical protein